jgi:hypothetical protein
VIRSFFRFETLEEVKKLLGFFFLGEVGRRESRLEVGFNVKVDLQASPFSACRVQQAVKAGHPIQSE